MGRWGYYLWLLVLSAGALAAVSCRHQAAQGAQASHGLPLLLEEAGPSEDLLAPSGPVADNSGCHVCHINYEDEELAVAHARANVGCKRCHGPSRAHCSDEDNITPPDIMYPVAKLNPSCLACHARDSIDIRPHKSLFGEADAPRKSCTDCHGDHRLGYRTRKWNKTTGELIGDR